MAYTFVLVHGAWHGGWCWQRVADRLRRGGHVVFTPTLTGLGERSHLLRDGIDLKTHITDVVNVMKWEDLSDVVLCGHSYGGFVISGVAEQMAPAISSIVFLDAFVPRNGECVLDLTGPAVQDGSPQRTATRRYRHPAAGRGSLRRQRGRPCLGGSSMRRAADRDLHRQDRAQRRARSHRAQELYPRQELRQSGIRPRLGRGAIRFVVAQLRSAERPRRDGRYAGAAHRNSAGNGAIDLDTKRLGH